MHYLLTLCVPSVCSVWSPLLLSAPWHIYLLKYVTFKCVDKSLLKHYFMIRDTAPWLCVHWNSFKNCFWSGSKIQFTSIYFELSYYFLILFLYIIQSSTTCSNFKCNMLCTNCWWFCQRMDLSVTFTGSPGITCREVNRGYDMGEQRFL